MPNEAEMFMRRLAADQLELRYANRIANARSKLLSFTCYTRPDYEINWHHRVLSRKLNDFAQKKIRFLMIFMPPRHGKSELCSRRLPALLHGLYPDAEIMAASYNGTLANDITRDVQNIMDTGEYKTLFPDSLIVNEGERHPKYIRNSEEHKIKYHRGSYRGQGVGGSFAGRGADFIIIDDPIKGREAADSPTFRKQVWDWYTGVLRNRLEKKGSILLVMTRWHQDDLAGRLLDKARSDPDADQWEVFSLPAIKEAPTSERPENPLDPRDIGDPLWPNKYDKKDLAALKSASTRDWLALFQQEPSDSTGNIFKRNWIRFYKVPPARFDEEVQSWDFTFKDSVTAAKVDGQVWGRKGADKYLLTNVNDRMGFIASVNAMLTITSKHPNAHTKLVEDKANGSAIIETLSTKLSGIVPVNPEGSKDARAWSVQSEWEAGNIYLPDPEIAPWVHDFIEEVVNFPNGKYRDRVDAMSQALHRLRATGNSTFTKDYVPNKIKSIMASIRGTETW